MTLNVSNHNGALLADHFTEFSTQKNQFLIDIWFE